MNNYLQEEKEKIEKSNFAIIIRKGEIMPMSHPDYYKNRTIISIFGINDNFININGQEYKTNSIAVLSAIRNLIYKNLNTLVKLSMTENNSFSLESNCIKIRLGKLLIAINDNIDNKDCDKFITDLKSIITNEEISPDEIDEIIEKITLCIKQLPAGSRFTIGQFLENEFYTPNNISNICSEVFKRLENENIKIDSVYNSNERIGLIQNIPYIKE